MALDAERLLNLKISPSRVAYTDRDVMLYALAVGADGCELDFVYEKTLSAIPSFATILCFNDTWLSEGGVALKDTVHGSLDLTFHAPLATSGEAVATTRIAGLVDKGEGRGGIILQEVALEQAGSKACTCLSSVFVRGGGGFGGSVGEATPSFDVPQQAPDVVVRVPTAPNQALLFRLLGDRNPLHIDPDVARQSGFQGPIMHGACTFGLACLTVIRAFCGGDARRLTRFAARFVGPLIPGQPLFFSFWREAGALTFRAATGEGAAVLDNGFAALET